MARLKKLYREDIRPALMERFGYSNIHQVPQLKKITLNIGVGYEGHMNKEIIEEAMRTLSTITGQRPIVTKSRKAVSNFRIRENFNIGVKVTLRDEIMYEFLDRMISVTIPRIRDFRGLNPRSFDGRGNYSLGVEEQNIFAEIDLDKVKHTLGMDITFTVDSEGDRQSYALMREFGMPFGREGDKYYDYEVSEQIAAEKL